MKLLIVLLISGAACTTSNKQVPGLISFSEEDAKVRRHAGGYSTSVIHHDPKNPDQHAESSINVDFNPQKTKQSAAQTLTAQPNAEHQNYPTGVHQQIQQLHQQQQQQQLQSQQQHQRRRQQQQQQRWAKSVQNYSSPQLVPHPQYSSSESIPQLTEGFHSTRSLYNSQPSQSFNVGYSVSFTGGHRTHMPRALSAHKLENAEIITGSRNAQVRKPGVDFNTDDLVNNALIDFKKQKISGIKPKFIKFNSGKENDAKTFIGNLAPKTQQFLSYLGDAKPIEASNIHFRQQLQANEAQTVPNSWSNLSPSVEIYRSRPFDASEQVEQSKHFDHAGALGNSQGFDYSNALGAQGEKLQVNYAQNFYDVQGNSLGYFEEKPKGSLPTYFDLTENLSAPPLIVPFTNTFEAINSLPVNIPNVGVSGDSQKDSNPQITQIQNSLLSLKLTPDETYVQDISLGPAKQDSPDHPITSLLPVAQQNLLTASQPAEATFDTSKGQVQNNAENSEQQFQGQIGNVQVQPLQGNFHDEAFQPFKSQQLQQSQQYSMYVPAPTHAPNRGFDQYFDQYFDHLQPQESRYEAVAVRSPKISTTGNINRMRLTRDMRMGTNLRPPPLQIARYRRTYTGY